MKNNDALFFSATPEDLSKGFVYDKESASHICLICYENFEDGRVYENEGKFYESHRFAVDHVRRVHGNPANWLMNLDKRLTGLSDIQKKLMACMLSGKDDKQTSEEMAITASTVRNHRFQLREREKQARVFLALMNILDNIPKGGEELLDSHRTAVQVDERFAITQEEFDEYVKKYFPDGPEGMITDFPTKEKRKIVILMQLVKRFEPEKRYTEKEVNTILKTAWHDFVTLRRYLIEYGFMDRVRDGSAYWVKK